MPDTDPPWLRELRRLSRRGRAAAAATLVRIRGLRGRRPVPFWTGVGVVGVVATAALLVVAMFTVDYVTAGTPPVGAAAIDPPTVVLDAAGEEIARLDPTTVGEQVRAEDLPDHVAAAVLAAEDRRYWEHGGVSVRGTLRAAWTNLRSGQVAQGASTITQQYVDLATPGSGRSLRAKLREAAAALKLDGSLGKAEVLDRYLNVVPFGRDAVGIDTAAQVYFRVPAADLDLNQAATLAGSIAAPSHFDPEANPDGAQRRRDVVLDAMVAEGWVDPRDADEVRGSALPALADTPLVEYGDGAYVVDAVRRTLVRELETDDVNRGLVVRTTIDMHLQELAQSTVSDHVGDQPWTGALVTIDPASGAVRALVGGSDFTTESYNAAIRAERQPGSAFKPFTLAAFVEAGYAPDGSRFEAPAELDVETDTETVTVQNFGDRDHGDMTVREATENSVNTVYMQMIDEVGADAVVDVAGRMGMRAELPPVPSIALGTGAVTPLDLASGYATLAAGGVHRTPSLVSKVTTTDGEVLHEAEVEEREAVSEQVAGVVTDVLTGVVSAGTGTAAQLDGHPVAGKTGTTDDGRDTWFAGYTAQLATVVWVGNPDNSPMGDVTGGELAAPLWHDYMVRAMEPHDPAELLTAGQDGLEALDRTDPDPPPSPDDQDRGKDDGGNGNGGGNDGNNGRGNGRGGGGG